ncbi:MULTISPECIES: hypothetical protein [Amycolatopsis]|nr:hypothetical protein [Amycolatopsis bullii]
MRRPRALLDNSLLALAEGYTELWGAPPGAFLGHDIGAYELVPQGGGDPHTCPGEPFSIGIVRTLAVRLAALDYDVPEQDLSVSLQRVPGRSKSGFILVPRPS